MRIDKIQFALWVAMEAVRFHIAQVSFFFLEDITHLVVQSEQFSFHEKMSWAKVVAGLLALPINILPILKMGGVILSGK